MTTVILVGQTMVIGLLGVLVFGLLRSHADIISSMNASHATSVPPSAAMSPDIPTPPERELADVAPRLVGATLTGDGVVIDFSPGGPHTMIAFLSSGCTTCKEFFAALDPTRRQGDALEARVVVVTKDAQFESPSKLIALAPDGLLVIQSSSGWEAYEVPGSPYFVYVDGATGTVQGEGTAQTWDQVEQLLRDALLDSAMALARQGGIPPIGFQDAKTGRERALRAEQALNEAGIPLDDDSLYELSDHERDSARLLEDG